MLLTIGIALAAAADCPRTYDTTDIVEAANAAESYFTKTDEAGFVSSHQALADRLGCSKDVLSLAAIARVHRVEVLAAFLEGREDRVSRALAGVFVAEPGHQIPATLVPDGHPVRGLIPNAMTALRDDPGVELPKPGSGWIEVDGTYAARAPVQRAALLQQIDGQGAVLATHYRWPDEPTFGWVVSVPPSDTSIVTAVPKDRPAATRKTPGPWARRGPLLGLSVASLVTSGALLALASDQRAEFEASPMLGTNATDDERGGYRTELEGIQDRVRGLSYACYAGAAAGLALGVVAVITW